jgi:hypothetical protein
VHKNAFLNLEAPTVPLDFAGVDAMAVRAALRFSTCPIQVDMATRNPYPLMALRDYGHGVAGAQRYFNPLWILLSRSLASLGCTVSCCLFVRRPRVAIGCIIPS